MTDKRVNDPAAKRSAARWRVYLWHRRRRLRLRRAREFNAMVQYRMVKDRRDELIVFADRVAVRDFVSRRVGDDLLTNLYAVITSADEVDDLELPREYVVKATHGSGAILIVSEHASPGTGVPAPGSGWSRSIAHADDVSRADLRRLCGEWLQLRYSSEWSEWAYTRIPSRVMFEEALLDELGQPPHDYKFFVFDGVPRLVQVDVSRFAGHQRNLYSPAWELIDVKYLYPRAEHIIEPPRQLATMLEVAAELGRGIDFVRVDLYDLGDRVVFGELTNYPEGGSGFFVPATFDLELGRHWKVNVRQHVADVPKLSSK
jgi:hypothetical protein